jgi:5-methylcytosine-specific restriction endonuclease McrA
MSVHKTQKWKNKRAKILRRDGYICQECKRFGKRHDAEMVHHIYPVETHPHLAFVNDNLVSLCNVKHNTMHDRVTNEITEAGKRWQIKVSPLLQAYKL